MKVEHPSLAVRPSGHAAIRAVVATAVARQPERRLWTVANGTCPWRVDEPMRREDLTHGRRLAGRRLLLDLLAVEAKSPGSPAFLRLVRRTCPHEVAPGPRFNPRARP